MSVRLVDPEAAEVIDVGAGEVIRVLDAAVQSDRQGGAPVELAGG